MRGQRGSALILTLILTVVLMAVALSLAMSSLGNFSMSEEFEQRGRALSNAEAGLVAAQRALRGRDASTLIATSSTVPVYVVAPTSTRDPIAFREARNVNFSHPPYAVTSTTLRGMLTSGAGVSYGRGRYFSRIADNNDGDNNPLADLDGRFIIRTVGIEPVHPQEVSSYGSAVKNSVVMVEAVLERDMSFLVSSPFSVYGRNPVPQRNQFFDGASFGLDGYDHSNLTYEQTLRPHHHNRNDPAQAGLSVLNDDPSAGDATAALDSIHATIDKNQADNIEGAEGPYGETPSMRDDTEAVRDSSNEDAKNVFDIYFMAAFIARVAAAADVVYPDGASVGAEGLGTSDNPKIVLAEGDLAIAGNGEGCGLLVVKGTLEYNGAFNYNGLILVIGDGKVDFGGANKSVVGGIYVARVETGPDGEPVFGTPSFTLGGSSKFFFRGDSIRMAVNLLPLRTISWREITPELDPSPQSPYVGLTSDVSFSPGTEVLTR